MATSNQQAKARQEIVGSAVMLLATLVVLVLALQGTFSAAWYFPHVFGVIIAGFVVKSLLTARTVLWKPRLLFAFAIIAVAAVAPLVHPHAVQRELEAYERRAMAALIGKVAPTIPFVRSVGMEDRGAGSLKPGGKLTLINFWSTTCSPCIAEMPMIEKFWKDHRVSGIDVVGVTKLYDGPEADSETRKVRAVLHQLGVTYPIVIADQDSPAHTAYGVESLPASILVDRDGSVITFGAGVRGTVRLMRQAQDRVKARQN